MIQTLTAHERAAFARAAKAMYARGANEQGHLLSVAAASPYMALPHYDRAADTYRAWLVFDEPKPCICGPESPAEHWTTCPCRTS